MYILLVSMATRQFQWEHFVQTHKNREFHWIKETENSKNQRKTPYKVNRYNKACRIKLREALGPGMLWLLCRSSASFYWTLCTGHEKKETQSLGPRSLQSSWRENTCVQWKKDFSKSHRKYNANFKSRYWVYKCQEECRWESCTRPAEVTHMCFLADEVLVLIFFFPSLARNLRVNLSTTQVTEFGMSPWHPFPLAHQDVLPTSAPRPPRHSLPVRITLNYNFLFTCLCLPKDYEALWGQGFVSLLPSKTPSTHQTLQKHLLNKWVHEKHIVW